jgi:hypothetical protein
MHAHINKKLPMHHNKTTCTTPTHNATIAQIKQHTCNVQKLKEHNLIQWKKTNMEIQTSINLYNA